MKNLNNSKFSLIPARLVFFKGGLPEKPKKRLWGKGDVLKKARAERGEIPAAAVLLTKAGGAKEKLEERKRRIEAAVKEMETDLVGSSRGESFYKVDSMDAAKEDMRREVVEDAIRAAKVSGLPLKKGFEIIKGVKLGTVDLTGLDIVAGSVPYTKGKGHKALIKLTKKQKRGLIERVIKK